VEGVRLLIATASVLAALALPAAASGRARSAVRFVGFRVRR